MPPTRRPARLAAPILAALVFVLAFAAAPAAAQAPACTTFFAGGTPPAVTNPRLAQGVVLLCNDAFANAASPVSRGALWSAERLTAASVAAARDIPREGEFHPEDRIDRSRRAELEDYRGSGYDRGHMAPSGDMPTPEAQQQSFSLANMIPQAAELNRGPWADIEGAVRRLAEARGTLFVVTGPAFTGNRIATVGADNVLVPTAVWKAVYDPAANAAGAYACSNTARPVCRTLAVATLAATVGIDPFPAVPAAVKARAMSLPTRGAHRPPRRAADRGFFDRLLNP